MPPGFTTRSWFLAEGSKFVKAASKVPSVVRIALIGSLTTNKREPNDIDLLVTVIDKVDWAELARLGRRLQGTLHAADIFVADQSGKYLGRTCQWRECRRGVRVRCEALHCGKQEYLYDDLQIVTLAKALVMEPPIELWPEVLCRVPMLPDVESELTSKLVTARQPRHVADGIKKEQT